MKTAFLCVLAVLLAVLCAFTLAAQGQKEKKDQWRVIYAPPYFLKAGSFIELSEADRNLYTEGLMDGFFASAFFGASDATVENLHSCTKDMDSKQISAIITKYVKDHPEKWHHPLSAEADFALNAACPGG